MPHFAQLPLTVCMIVRNEADNLPDAIRSVRSWAAEIVIVDTGSTDTTKQIAFEAGCQVFDFTWVDDFAKARNFALSQAVQPWILSLDADQRVSVKSYQAIQTFISSSADAGVVEISTLDTAGHEIHRYPAVRIFRNDKRIQYAGRVHESVSDALVLHGLSQENETNIVFEDMGYGDAEVRQQKKQRNLILLQQSYDQGTSDLYLTYKYLQVIRDSQIKKRVLANVRERLQNDENSRLEQYPFIDELVAWCAHDLTQLGELQAAYDFALAMKHRVQGHCIFIAGVMAAKAGLFEDAAVHFQSYAIEGPHIHRLRKIPLGYSTVMLNYWRAWCLRLQGAFDAAIAQIDSVLKLANVQEQQYLRCEKIRTYLSRGDLQRATVELTELMAYVERRENIEDIYFVAAEISIQSGQYDQAKAFLSLIMSGDERLSLLSALIAFYQHEFELARSLLESVQGVDCLNVFLKEQLTEALHGQ